jgi:hypothetical protein
VAGLQGSALLFVCGVLLGQPYCSLLLPAAAASCCCCCCCALLLLLRPCDCSLLLLLLLQMIGIWCVLMWQSLGQPQHLNLVELGPGRGTLMADLLRGTAAFTPFADALQVQQQHATQDICLQVIVIH